jgi:hypothetical protein
MANENEVTRQAAADWPQVRSGPLVAAGAATWQEHPNAKVRLARRASSAGLPS